MQRSITVAGTSREPSWQQKGVVGDARPLPRAQLWLPPPIPATVGRTDRNGCPLPIAFSSSPGEWRTFSGSAMVTRITGRRTLSCRGTKRCEVGARNSSCSETFWRSLQQRKNSFFISFGIAPQMEAENGATGFCSRYVIGNVAMNAGRCRLDPELRRGRDNWRLTFTSTGARPEFGHQNVSVKATVCRPARIRRAPGAVGLAAPQRGRSPLNTGRLLRGSRRREMTQGCRSSSPSGMYSYGLR